MAIYQKLEDIRQLTNSSLTSIIDVSNLNFTDLSSAALEFLGNIKYDEVANSFEVNRGTFNFVEITDTLSLNLDGVPTFTIDSLGRAEGQELLVQVAETKRLRMRDFNDWPDVGVPGEIIYTGIQNQKPQFGEDFIGYLQTRGWVSLTDGSGSGFITLTELSGSPPIPPNPNTNQGIIWIGPPGYETEYEPTTQTVYYTDENGDIFDLVTDPIWTRVGSDGKFKLPGKVIIGDPVETRALQYVDGNQQPGYVLTSDADGNASWQPPSVASGGFCSNVQVQPFTAGVPQTIVHNLNTLDVIIQLIDFGSNQEIDAFIDDYQLNSIRITTTISIASAKIIVLAANCGAVGPIGPAGTSGTSGIDGTSGTSGSSGTSGTSGSSGT